MYIRCNIITDKAYGVTVEFMSYGTILYLIKELAKK